MLSTNGPAPESSRDLPTAGEPAVPSKEAPRPRGPRESTEASFRAVLETAARLGHRDLQLLAAGALRLGKVVRDPRGEAVLVYEGWAMAPENASPSPVEVSETWVEAPREHELAVREACRMRLPVRARARLWEMVAARRRPSARRERRDRGEC